ncbi:MAG TPA: hypothetical protein VFD66_06790 [Verrucomicrobiae bacterium]|nr:hypothetical protein [Verrucomicrobiae bacterium]
MSTLRWLRWRRMPVATALPRRSRRAAAAREERRDARAGGASCRPLNAAGDIEDDVRHHGRNGAAAQQRREMARGHRILSFGLKAWGRAVPTPARDNSFGKPVCSH